MKISEGLYEVLTSDKLSIDQKCESVRFFTYALRHLDGDHKGFIEPPELASEDAELIIEALKAGNFVASPTKDKKAKED